ncbi:hypothetical protein AA3266_2651 [Gluconobacter kondonii NBRC 3266]|nr:hypothetical protein AA3266_2651 [Gluconobacter kondonii NBRC 3266]
MLKAVERDTPGETECETDDRPQNAVSTEQGFGPSRGLGNGPEHQTGGGENGNRRIGRQDVVGEFGGD